MPEHRFSLRRRVEFADTDAAGLMHFSNFFRFMEATEHAFHRSLGLSFHDFRPGTDAAPIGWPRVHAAADYKLPLHFGDDVEVELLIEKIGATTIHYRFCFWKSPDDGGDRTLAATGRCVAACVTFGGGTTAPPGISGAPMKAIPIPDAIREKLAEALPETIGGPS